MKTSMVSDPVGRATALTLFTNNVFGELDKPSYTIIVVFLVWKGSHFHEWSL